MVSHKFSAEELADLLFPHDQVRETQDKLIRLVSKALTEKKNLIVHAPTGLGKTAATLAPALSHAIDKNLTIFFLTSRHTQHNIVIDTLKKIREKYADNNDCSANSIGCSIIGKKWMCSQPGVDLLRTSDFHEFCRSMVAGNKCEFFEAVKIGAKLSPAAQGVVSQLTTSGANLSEKIFELSKDAKLCPYEIATEIAAKSKVIVCDYFYLFNEDIRNAFLKKIGKKLSESIIIIDEGHNLPDRIREQLSISLTSFVIRNAITESKKFNHKEIIPYITQVQETLLELSEELKIGQEKLVETQEFIQTLERRLKLIDEKKSYDELLSEFDFIGDAVRQTQRSSFIGSIGNFLEAWRMPDEGYARIISLKDSKIKQQLNQVISRNNSSRQHSRQYISLSARCLDPSMASSHIIKESYSTIIMSGTLEPTEMYFDLLDFPKNTLQEVFPSPFPKEYRLNLIIPQTTTKYDARSESQYREIAKILVDITARVPGNSAIFFPSYSLLDSINKYFQFESRVSVLKEMAGMTKQEKDELLERFKNYGTTGKQRAVILGATSGSFGEGIDLPGNHLKSVIIVGLPLSPPDLEKKELIRYYQEKFERGMDYGYFLPAFIKTFQNAGRCIRSETDKGLIVYLDQRYSWPNYLRFFPEEWNLRISTDYTTVAEEFFGSHIKE